MNAWHGLKIVIVLSLLATSAQAGMFDDWSREDYAFQATATVLHLADWLQTRDIATNEEFRELNVLLGENPSLDTVNLYFAGTLIGSWLIADLLSPRWRNRFQYFHIGMEAACVGNNLSAGVGFKF